MSWKQTPRGTRITFWVALVLGVSFIAFFVYLLWFTANFKPI
jgi:hypothetical protein